MHFHSFLHLIHYARYARLLGSTRVLGTMLLMLFFSLPQLDIAEPVSALFKAKANRDHVSSAFFSHGSTASVNGVDRIDTVPPAALTQNAHASVFHRLKPGIVMIPRMNRTPKPKSVYRCFTRAPGIGNVVTCNA